MFRTYQHVSQRIVGHFCSSWKPTTPGREERRAESTSSRPACVLAHVTLNRAPTCVEIPQSMEVLKHGQMRFLRFPPARCVPQVRPRPLASASIPQNLPVSPPLFKRDTGCSLPALVSPSTSIHLHISPWLPSSWLCSPHRALSDASGRIPLSQGAQTTGSRQADGQTEAEIASGLSHSMSFSHAVAPLISISLSLMHLLRPSSPLLLSFSPIKSLFPVCISSRSCFSSLTCSFSLTHLASLLFVFFSSH